MTTPCRPPGRTHALDAMAAIAALALAAALPTPAGGATAAPTPTPLKVEVHSLDRVDDQPLVLTGYWFARRDAVGGVGAAPLRPAMVLLHGCGGMLDRQGRPGARYTGMAAELDALGIDALALDSFGVRGQREICTQRASQRAITPVQRRLDVHGALAWLAQQPGVDPARVGLLGWSHGGSAVLASVDAQRPRPEGAPDFRPSLAVAYYPGCAPALRTGFRAELPLLLLLGELDDWTAPGPCKALAAANPGHVEWASFEGAYHGFDGPPPVRLRRDVPGGVNPGRGVHVGGDPAAREAAALRLDSFLRQHWSLR